MNNDLIANLFVKTVNSTLWISEWLKFNVLSKILAKKCELIFLLLLIIDTHTIQIMNIHPYMEEKVAEKKLCICFGF